MAYDDIECFNCRYMNEDEDSEHCCKCVKNATNNFKPKRRFDIIKELDVNELAKEIYALREKTIVQLEKYLEEIVTVNS